MVFKDDVTVSQLQANLAHLQKQFSEFTGNLTQLQTCVREVALEYHSIPLQIRGLAANDRNLANCMREFTIPESGRSPQIIQQITTLRKLKEDIRTALCSAANKNIVPPSPDSAATDHSGQARKALQADLDTADESLEIGEDLMEDVANMLSALEMVVVMTRENFVSNEPQDYGPPTATGQPEKYALFREFVLHLPEAQRMMADLGESESSAMEMCTSADQDRLVFEYGNSDGPTGAEMHAEDPILDNTADEAPPSLVTARRVADDVAMAEIRAANGLLAATGLR